MPNPYIPLDIPLRGGGGGGVKDFRTGDYLWKALIQLTRPLARNSTDVEATSVLWGYRGFYRDGKAYEGIYRDMYVCVPSEIKSPSSGGQSK